MLAPSLSKGRPLDLQLRATLEPRLGHDFSRVRVHHDEGAARAAKAQGASAYTLGADIVFGRDRYRPQSPDGLRLLSHELAHVVQQSPARRAPSSHGSATTSETRALEADADRAADAVVGRCRLPPGGLLAAPRMVQRQTAGTPPAADGEKEKAEAAHLAD
ncbi:MAG: DUF4157 domain-containing protein, partial [Acidobacteria bacterium]|nr:DUF4157 domain-containing protein [Acidobacteriota bacterium]